uniref:Ribosomal protein S3 n=1 Tax=Ochromonas danica TaxID=2986 RepID=Q9G916_OCHDN|nr:ribosomal protein S3 [Ochromonas danica]AAG18389.1 ribosomal protein S3 [Ochromonas danica]
MQNNHLIQNLTTSQIKYDIINNFKLTSNIVTSLKKKDIIVSHMFFSEKGITKKLNIYLFYRTHKLKKYLIKTKRKGKYKKNKKNEIVKLLGEKNLSLVIKVLNRQGKSESLRVIAAKFKYYLNKIFQKRLTLFIDLVKVFYLVAKKKATIHLLIYILGLIFKPLHKKKHAIYLAFLKKLFSYLIFRKHSQIKGVKLIIAGRLKGKTRAKTSKFILGKIPLSSEKEKIKASQTHIYTVYGCFGLKLWVNYK